MGFPGEGLARELQLDCEVVRHAEEGLGVRFLNLTQATRELLQQLIGEMSAGTTPQASSTEYSRVAPDQEPRRERVPTAPMADMPVCLNIGPQIRSAPESTAHHHLPLS